MLAQLSQSIIHLIQASGYFGIFILMTLESMLLPIPSEVTMPFAGFLAQQGHINLWITIFLGALGNLTGSLIAYAIGYFLEDTVILSLIHKYGKWMLLSSHEYERSLKWFEKYGNGLTFFSRLLPVVRTFISLPAGLAKMNIIKFSLYTFLGSLIWSAVLAYIGFYLGKNWENIHTIFSKFQYAVIATILLLIAWYITYHLKKRKNK